jgi:DNA-directed RNA polymerase subunit RPC12/RpoP
MKFIDYSQYSLFKFCEYAWYERYVRGLQTKYPADKQRDDAIALGSLVHAGLEVFAKTGKPEIPKDVVDEMIPTPECFVLANTMVQGYIKKYPSEVWPVEQCEEPLVWELVPEDIVWACCKCGVTGNSRRHIKCPNCLSALIDQPVTISIGQEQIFGLAKFDSFFYVPEDTTIESGLPGESITLARGWWSKEYKTKSSGVNRATWIMEWQTKFQADFQMIALQNRIGEAPKGVMVCVLEKPREYTPKRKCAGCGETWEMASYLSTGDGHACPACDYRQKLKPYEPKVPRIPEFYRVLVTRSPEELERSEIEIRETALRMEALRQNSGLIMPNRDNCVSNKFHRVCEFFKPHRYNYDAGDRPAEFEFRDTTKYASLDLVA